MQHDIPGLVDKWFTLLRSVKPDSPKLLPGLNADTIQEVFSVIGLSCPDDVISLYSSNDGTDSPEGAILDDIYSLPGFYWMDLKQAATVYRSISQNSAWSNMWFPIFANGGGDFYAIVCDESSAHYGQVVGFLLGETSHLVEYQDVPHMLDTIVSCFEHGIFFMEDGYLEANDEAMQSLALGLRPRFVQMYIDA